MRDSKVLIRPEWEIAILDVFYVFKSIIKFVFIYHRTYQMSLNIAITKANILQ